MKFAFTFLIFSMMLSSCTTINHPRDRAVLAQPNMDSDFRSVHEATNDHVYFSKEATSGGRNGSGGGCGCN